MNQNDVGWVRKFPESWYSGGGMGSRGWYFYAFDYKHQQQSFITIQSSGRVSSGVTLYASDPRSLDGGYHHQPRGKP